MVPVATPIVPAESQEAEGDIFINITQSRGKRLSCRCKGLQFHLISREKKGGDQASNKNKHTDSSVRAMAV